MNRTINISASCIIVTGINGAIYSSLSPAMRFILHRHPTGSPLKVWALSSAAMAARVCWWVYTSLVGCLVSFANRTIDISASCIIVIGISDAIYSSLSPTVLGELCEPHHRHQRQLHYCHWH
ncbi:hypothetical protein KO512_12290, partial [Amphritea atlantica]|nr:hypothetical protein [Amphritea atlantica]